MQLGFLNAEEGSMSHRIEVREVAKGTPKVGKLGFFNSK
jgi:hypothetical protein